MAMSRQNKKKVRAAALLMSVDELFEHIRDGKKIDFMTNKHLLLQYNEVHSSSANKIVVIYPLQYAVSLKRIQVVREIIEVLKSIDTHQEIIKKIYADALKYAIIVEDFTTFQLLIGLLNANDIIAETVNSHSEPVTGIAINVTISNYPIHYACLLNRVDMVKDIISRTPTTIDLPRIGDKTTPLQIACSLGYKEIAEFLIEKGAEIDKRNAEDYTAVYFAVQEEKEEIIKLLSKHKANLDIIDKRGHSLLSYSAYCGDIKIVKLLLQLGANVNFSFNEFTPFYLACQEGHLEIAKCLHAKGATIGNALLIACKHNQAKIVEYLLKELKVDLYQTNDATNFNGFLLAAKYGANAVLEYLINYALKTNPEDGANDLLRALNKENLTGLAIAFEKEKKSTMMLLFKYNMPLLQHVTKQKTLLHLMFYYEDEWKDMVAFVLGRVELVNRIGKASEKIDVNCRDLKGRTPLHILVSHGRLQFLQQLLTLGADINSLDNESLTPLHYAAYIGNIDMVCALLQKGADINLALKSACQYIDLTAIDILLKSKPDNQTLNQDTLDTIVDLWLEAKKLTNSMDVLIALRRIKNNLPTSLMLELQETDTTLETQQEASPIPKKKQINHIDYGKQDNTYTSSHSSHPLFQTPKTKSGVSAHAHFQSQGLSKDEIKELLRKKEEGQSELNKTNKDEIKANSDETLTWFNGAITSKMDEVKEVRNAHRNVMFYCPPNIKIMAKNGVFKIDRPKLVYKKGQQGIKHLKHEKFGLLSLLVNDQTYPDFEITSEFKTKLVEHKKERFYHVEVVSDNGKGKLIVPVLFSPQGLHKPRDKKALSSALDNNTTIKIETPSKSK